MRDAIGILVTPLVVIRHPRISNLTDRAIFCRVWPHMDRLAVLGQNVLERTLGGDPVQAFMPAMSSALALASFSVRPSCS